ncbi:MFS transporter [Nonomuraea sp. NPDC050556]|uniref:MFS transporter n=1 Tax=Nonomuraea sp. NPDC050556 TaxID=3364369 RepID=UPI0037B52BB9
MTKAMIATGRRGALVVLLAGQLMTSMDSSLISVALPAIRAGFAASGVTVQLIASGYILTLGVLIVTGARLGDVLGQRRAFLLGLVGFTAGSALCAAAPSAGVLVAIRTAQAVAAALMIPQVFALIQLEFDKRAIGLYSMTLGLAATLGQLLGGLVVSAAGWRAVFLVNVPIGVVTFLAGLRLLPETGRRAVRLDPVGILLLTGGMLGLIAPLLLGRQYGWQPWTWAVLGAGIVVLGAFAAHERRASAPLLEFAAVRRAWAGLAACFVLAGAYAALLFALTLHLQGERGMDPLRAGLTFLPFTVAFGAMSLVGPRLAWRQLPSAGIALFAAAVVGIAVLLPAGEGWLWVLLVLAGIGHGAGYAPLMARLTRVVGPSGASALAALNSTGPMLASATAVALLGGFYLEWGLTAALTGIGVVLAAGVWLGFKPGD